MRKNKDNYYTTEELFNQGERFGVGDLVGFVNSDIRLRDGFKLDNNFKNFMNVGFVTERIKEKNLFKVRWFAKRSSPEILRDGFETTEVSTHCFLTSGIVVISRARSTTLP